jgi:Fe-Mn family superoxide dismutase
MPAGAGANKALDRLAGASGPIRDIGALEKALAFNLSGHVLHSAFWQSRSGAGERPQGRLASRSPRVRQLRDLRNRSTPSRHHHGSGWAALVWEPLGKKLLVSQIYDHQSNLAQAGTPLLVLDAWEHAYYLQYENRKTEFFDAVWNVWNWADVAERFQAACRGNVALVGAGVGVD